MAQKFVEIGRGGGGFLLQTLQTVLLFHHHLHQHSHHPPPPPPVQVSLPNLILEYQADVLLLGLLLLLMFHW